MAIPGNRPPEAQTGEPLPSARSTLELVGLVVAPTTLVTGLAFYFGWVLTNARASYFGIDASALGYSTQDYVLRSVDALYVPAGAGFVLALGLLWLHVLATRQLANHARRARLRIAARVAVLAGGVLFATGVLAVFEPLSFSPYYLFPSASPGIGIALLAYALNLLGRVDAAEHPEATPAAGARSHSTAVALVGLLIVLSAFSTASKYADMLGGQRAAELAATLSRRPQVTVFAPKRLNIEANGVVERRLTGKNLAYRYRYSGLRLLIRSGAKYFLLPDGWTRSSGTAIVLGDTPDYRFEFGTGTGVVAAKQDTGTTMPRPSPSPRPPAPNSTPSTTPATPTPPGAPPGKASSTPSAQPTTPRFKRRQPPPSRTPRTTPTTPSSTSTAGPIATVFAGPPIEFPPVALGRTLTVTRTLNVEGQKSRIVRIAITGKTPSDFHLSVETCIIGTEIPAGGSCTLSVTFAPVVLGSRQADLEIEIRPGQPQVIGLNGTGSRPRVP